MKESIQTQVKTSTSALISEISEVKHLIIINKGTITIAPIRSLEIRTSLSNPVAKLYYGEDHITWYATTVEKLLEKIKNYSPFI